MNENVKNRVVTILFIIIIFGFSIINIVVKDTEISNTERRKLKQFSAINIKDITSGKLPDEIENYLMDQFVQRDTFRSIKTFFKLNILCQKENNGFFKVENNVHNLLYPLSSKNVLNTANKINNIYDTYLDETNSIFYTIVPDKNYYLADKSGYLKLDYNKLSNMLRENIDSNIEYIDIFDTVTATSYYNTDAHWSQEYLLDTAEKIAEKMNFKDRINSEFILKDYNKFYGTYYGQLADSSIEEDTLKYYSNDIIENAKVYNYETKQETKIYDEEKFNTSMDKYEFFLSGSTPLLKITNEFANNDKTLIVFRDSFASSLVPLFTEAYNNIYLVDIRYIKSELLKDYIDFKNADVLFMYSTLVINESGSLK